MDNDDTDILKPDSNGYYESSNIARLLDLEYPNLLGYVKRGILPAIKDANNRWRFELVPTIQSYIKHLREKIHDKELLLNENGEVIGGYCGSQMLAKMLNLSPGHIAHLAKDGKLPTVKGASQNTLCFELIPAVRQYVKQLQKEAPNKIIHANQDGEIINGYCGAEIIAQLLDMPLGTVLWKAQRGHFPTVKDDNNRYSFELIPTVQSYVKYLREKAQDKPESSNSDLQRRKLEADIALKEKRVQYLDGQLVRDFPHKSRKAAKKEQMRNEISRMSTEEIYALLEKLDEEEEDEEDDET